MKNFNLSFLLSLIVFTVTSCSNRKVTYTFLDGFTQGTSYHITYGSNTGENYQPEIDALLKRFDMSLSAYVDSSVISRINRDEDIQADDMFIEVFRVANEVYEETNGAFDITVGPVVNALGFGSTKGLDVDSSLIDSLRQFVGMNKVKLESGRIIKEKPGIILDVNAIAQGYSVDVVARFLENKGIKNYMVEIGGEVRAKGINPKGKTWRIGIDKPIEGNMIAGAELQDIVSLDDKSLATSGNYRRFFMKEGVKYTHTIDPHTGYPVVSRLLSATVVANSCIVADAYATAFMVMGFEASVDFVKSHKDLDAYFISGDEDGTYQIWYSGNMEKMLSR